MSVSLAILFLILLALAAPVGIKKNSLLWLLAGMALSFVVVVLPLFIYFFSSLPLMLPDWKGACRYGWVDCFIVGKLALAPLVLAATAALYKVEVLRADVSKERWAVLAIFLGAIVAWTCFGFGLICLKGELFGLNWLLVPFYIAVWYTGRTIVFMQAASFGFRTYFVTALGTIPFWLVSWLWSRSVFQSLPNTEPQGCFVVTAAGCGHRKLVGPFQEIERDGKRRQANRQLVTLWQFEHLWREKSPRSHRHFRRFYNRVGPCVAAHIRSPWVADAAFIALKPVELAAQCLNRKIKA